MSLELRLEEPRLTLILTSFYAELARQALARWRTPAFSQNYHECGVMVGSSKDEPEGTRYVQGSLAVNSRPEMVCAGKKAYSLDSADEIKKCYPGIQTGAFERHAACEYCADLVGRSRSLTRQQI